MPGISMISHIPHFTYNDTVRVKSSAPVELRPGELASVVSVDPEESRRGDYLKEFPFGVVYTVEFEDGSSVQVHEDFHEKGAFPSELS